MHLTVPLCTNSLYMWLQLLLSAAGLQSGRQREVGSLSVHVMLKSRLITWFLVPCSSNVHTSAFGWSLLWHDCPEGNRVLLKFEVATAARAEAKRTWAAATVRNAAYSVLSICFRVGVLWLTKPNHSPDHWWKGWALFVHLLVVFSQIKVSVPLQISTGSHVSKWQPASKQTSQNSW